MAFKQGKFTPFNPQKYVGDVSDIVFRSSWEQKMCQWLDFNPAVLKWGSETVVIPYFYEIDNKWHRYFVDFIMTVKNSKGIEVTYLIEIKPKKDTVANKPKRMTEKAQMNYTRALLTKSKNEAKWKAATEYATQNGMTFKVITEDELFS